MHVKCAQMCVRDRQFARDKLPKKKSTLTIMYFVLKLYFSQNKFLENLPVWWDDATFFSYNFTCFPDFIKTSDGILKEGTPFADLLTCYKKNSVLKLSARLNHGLT